jgi:hypothetical protein
MHFICMGFERAGEWVQLDEAEQQRRMAKHQEGLNRLFAQRSAAGRPHLSFSVGLHDPEVSTKVRFDGERHIITDGPFAESKEVLAGFDVINFDSRDAAVEWNQSLGFDHKGHISEVRRVEGGGLIYHGHQPTAATKYLLQFAANPRPGTQQAYDRVSTEYVYKGFMDESICLATARLADPTEALTFRNRDGKIVASNGPFSDGRDALGGLIILDCASRDAALDWARRYSSVAGVVTEVTRCGMWWAQLL